MSDLGYEYVWAVSKMGGWIVGTVQPRLSGPRLSGPLIIRTSWNQKIHYHACACGCGHRLSGALRTLHVSVQTYLEQNWLTIDYFSEHC